MTLLYEWVCFDIPFFLQVPDSFRENKFARFYPVINGKSAELRFKRVSVENRAGMVYGMIPGDRLGNFSRTEVRVGFDKQIIDIIPETVKQEGSGYAFASGLRGRDGFLIGKAVQYLNRFLSVYRNLTGHYWIRQLNPQEIASYELVGVTESRDTNRRSRMVSGGALQFPTATFERSDIELINGHLRSESPLSIIDTIDLDTKDKIDLREYNLAVLNAERLFEVWLKKAFELVLSERGQSDEEIESLLKRDNGNYERLTQIVSNYVQQHLNFDFQDTSEYDNWMNETHRVRNAVAHEGYAANQREAVRAYESSLAAMALLSKEFEDELADTDLLIKLQGE